MNEKTPFILLGVGAVALAGLAFAFVGGDGHGMKHDGANAEASHSETGHAEAAHSETGHGTSGHGDGHDAEMAIGKPAKGHEARMVIVSMKETTDGTVFEPFALTFKAGETVKIRVTNAGELEHEFVWTFTNAGSFEFAGLIPGHYEAGMHGPILVN